MRKKRQEEREPFLVSHSEAMRLLGVGSSKYWGTLVKQGIIKTVQLGRRTQAEYASVKRAGGQ